MHIFVFSVGAREDRLNRARKRASKASISTSGC